MSVDIYPAYLKGRNIIHADNWDDSSTMNLANGNFFSLADELGLSDLMEAPGHIKIKTIKVAMQMKHSPRYSERLKTLIARAEILKATHIAFS